MKDNVQTRISHALKDSVENKNTSVSAAQIWHESRGKRTIGKRRMAIVAMAVVLFLGIVPAVGYSYVKNYLDWGSQDFTVRTPEDNIVPDVMGEETNWESPVDSFTQILKEKDKLTAAEVQKLAFYPLRSLDQLEGWHKTVSAGFVKKHYSYADNSGKDEVVTPLGPAFVEIFENDSQQHIVVVQGTDYNDLTDKPRMKSDHMSYSYPASWKFVEGFGEDIALIRAHNSGWKEMHLYHEEKNKTVTIFEFHGMEEQLLIDLAHRYLSLAE
ncbi:hypothetical protein H70357_30080 [Paenibacillus sp. FSL H7-0357]|uniref:hypothetical protein n=1 Tax=Paenibacillus sp. FSL H7-0357 TaxID=1536774 RepID=UPI0004F6161F|nr:hypothetical protein [Paenibacillus sp. FSL H7-0357]AIQ20479.1 hypothetical protein H70357_30080 [Paenibacillus sp. FSL H7-0357]